MKKGCFITAITVFTIFLGAVLYIFQNHFDDFFGKPAKKILAVFIKNEIDKELESVIESPEKIELKKMIKDLSEDSDRLQKLNKDDADKLMKLISAAISDSVIQKSELEEISHLIKPK